MIYFDESLLDYSFPPPHPFNSARLADAMKVLGEWGLTWSAPGRGTRKMAAAVHGSAYLDHLERCGLGEELDLADVYRFGVGTADTPAFVGIYQAALAVLGGSVTAAEQLLNGGGLAINLAGGLHHAHPSYASGFCALNDIACAIHRLKEGFERIAYIDVDLHHGDGVQAIFVGDPRVITASIHEFEPGFYPGTGWLDEGGPHTVNIPVAARTNGPLWIQLFQRALLAQVERFEPTAIVLQMGVDAHTTDPLGHLHVSGRWWLKSIRLVRELGCPILALGGGGYDRANPPRLWPAAVCTLLGREIPSGMPDWFVDRFGIRSTLDDEGDDLAAPLPARMRAEEILAYQA